MLKRLFFANTSEDTLLQTVTITILRVYVGLAMAFGHGLSKVPPSDKFVEGVVDLGFPAPQFFAWAAGLSELAGGIMLALGLATRPSAFFVGFTMFVAAFGRHAEDPFKAKELPLFYLCACLVFVVRGASQWSIDKKLA